MSGYVPVHLRRLVAERAAGYCEYCYAPIEMLLGGEVDHIKPEISGGTTTEDNLCQTCTLCNGAKYDFETGTDPETGQEIALFHPRQQIWHDHMMWSADFLTILPRTATGRATIERLQLNRDRFRLGRKWWLRAGWLPPTSP